MRKTVDAAKESHVETLLHAGTAVISDVFDAMGFLPPVLDNALKPVGEANSFAGPAYTITGESVRFEGGDRRKLAAIDAIPVGAVTLWASMDARGICCFGDLLASAMQARGCVAAVVDGGVRDAAFLEHCGMPVVARYKTPAQGVGRWRVTSSQTAIQVRGALVDWLTVNPDDIVVGDLDGVIVVPQSVLGDVVSRVTTWTELEQSARAEIADGLTLIEALEKYGHL